MMSRLLLVFARIAIIYTRSTTTNVAGVGRKIALVVESAVEGYETRNILIPTHNFHNISIPLAFIGAERTKASFAIRRVFHEFNIPDDRCLDSRDLVSPSRRIEAERKKSKHFKCSYQVFPVDHTGFLKSL